MPATKPIDPLVGPKLALGGRVVTMDRRNRVRTRGVVYVENGTIVAVRDRGDSAPEGFEDVDVVDTGGTMFPGLIELHNHLAYDVLPMWRVPRRFEHRGQWGGSVEYRRRITGPMSVLGRSRSVASVIRYVECKTLLAGVTTTQGVELFSNAGVRRYYRGIVRNVEQTDDDALPEAVTRIADVDARDAKRFLARLEQGKKLILHLSEGIGSDAREHFLALHLGRRKWAINENLVGIHCAGLQAKDFAVLGRHGASMVWSPLSNFLLYGETADVAAAKREGVRIGLGSDWSPTGSKNLLGELKVARLASRAAGDVFSDRELVAMATRDGAAILGWDAALGSLEAGKRADLMVVDGESGDPYVSLLRTDESEVRLVMINGVARAGLPSLIKRLTGAAGERVRVGNRVRALYLKQKTGDEAVGRLTLAQATQRLEDALERLSTPGRRLSAPELADDSGSGGWTLALDELADTGLELRPRLPVAGRAGATGPSLPRSLPAPAAAAAEMEPIELDPISVVDDSDYLDLIAEEEMNLPSYVSGRLASLYD